MSDAAIAVGVALLVAIAVAAVAWPFVSPARGVPEPVLSERDRRRIELLERRDAAYSGLRDLEQDHRTGKVSDDDYQAERRRLRGEAAGVLRDLDALDSTTGRSPRSAEGGLMGLWSRFTMLFKTKASKALDRAENPADTLDYSYTKQLELLQKVKRGVAEVVTAKKRLQMQTDRLEQSVVKLDSQARQALSGGREDLARMALERKVLIQGQLQDLDQQIAGLEGQQATLVQQERTLAAKVDAFRTQKEVIKAQYSAAEAQVKIGEATTGLSGELSDVGMAVQRAHDKTEQMRARAAAGRGAGGDRRAGRPVGTGHFAELDRQIAAMSADSQIENEMARCGQR